MMKITELIHKIDHPHKNRCLQMWIDFKNKYPKAKGSSYNHQNWEGGYYDHVRDTLQYALWMYDNLNSIQWEFLEPCVLISYFVSLGGMVELFNKPIRMNAFHCEDNSGGVGEDFAFCGGGFFYFDSAVRLFFAFLFCFGFRFALN